MSLDGLYRALRGELLAWLRPRVGDAAEDLLHVAFERLHQRAADLPEVRHLRGFVYTVLRRLVVDHHRALGRSVPEAEVDAPAGLDPHGTPPDGGLDARLAQVLPLFLAELPEADAHALRRVALDGVSQVALARELGLSVSGAKSRVQRARGRLRQVIEACCAVEVDRYGALQICEPKGPTACDC